MSETGAAESLRAKAHHLLAREESGPGGQAVRAVLVLLIVISVTTAVLKSMPQIGREYSNLFDLVLLFTAFGFAVEYTLRIWIGSASCRSSSCCGIPRRSSSWLRRSIASGAFCRARRC